MNKRINQLYEQALEFAYENVSKEIWNTDNFHAIVAGKFAELIVKECVQVLDTCHVDIAEDADLEDNNTWVNATMNTTINFCMGRVKQHFGVEE